MLPDGLEAPARFSAFAEAVALCGKPKIDVVEVGVTLEPSNGLSTVFWLADERVFSLRSIDINELRLAEVALRFPSSSQKMTPLVGHSLTWLSALPNDSVDLLYLDGDDDPVLTLHELLVALPKLRPGAVVLVDDLRTKGRLLKRVASGDPLRHQHEPYGRWSLKADISGYQELEPLGMMLFKVDRMDGFSCS
jgi:predicted O-methyltransferase YrrM